MSSDSKSRDRKPMSSGAVLSRLLFSVHVVVTLFLCVVDLIGRGKVIADAAGPVAVPVAAASAAAAASGASVPGCPRTCFCNALSRIVYCSRRGLDSVPNSLPVGSLQLNLNGNRFRSTSLLRANFSSTALQGGATIEHLYLSDCGIETVQVGTFTDLTSLRWLDLSDNRLTIIPARCFHGLSLQYLFLNGNRGIRLDKSAFNGLVVTGLYLHDCRLDDFDADTLTPLNGTLVNLWLNSNRLTSVDRRLAPLFAGLAHLRLGSNPLRCNCETLWLKELYDRRGGDSFRGAEQPTCATPGPIAGRHFGQLSVSDFRCRAPVFGNVDAAFYPMIGDVGDLRTGGSRKSRGHLRCSATGEPTPTLYWIRPSGKTIRYDSTMSSSAQELNERDRDTVRSPTEHNRDSKRYQRHAEEGRNEAILELTPEVMDGELSASGEANPFAQNHGDGGFSFETGMYICIATNDVGNVTLTVNLSWPTTSASATLQRNSLPVGLSRDGAALYAPLGIPTLVSDAGVKPTRFPSLTVIDLDGSVVDKNRQEKQLSDDDQTLYRLTDRPEVAAAPDVRMFTATEMAVAVVGTHAATLLLMLAIAAVTMPRCRRFVSSAAAARRRRRQQPPSSSSQHTAHGAGRQSNNHHLEFARTGSVNRHFGNTPIMSNTRRPSVKASSAELGTYDVEDSLLYSTPSRTIDSSSRSPRDFSSTFSSRKYFWPPIVSAGTADCESS